MTKYYLKDHVTDEMLQSVGFEITTNSWGYKWAVRNAFENSSIAITLHDMGSDYRLVTAVTRNYKKYIKDLIDLDYVEVRK